MGWLDPRPLLGPSGCCGVEGTIVRFVGQYLKRECDLTGNAIDT